MSSPKIVATGARSAQGLSALSVAMCMRARKFEPRATEFKDSWGNLIGCSRAPNIPDDVTRMERFLALAVPALKECGCDPHGDNIVILALPYVARLDQDENFGAEFMRRLSERSGYSIDLRRSKIFRNDNAGGAYALAEAKSLMDKGLDTAVVGGVDTHFDGELLKWLDEDRRLHTSKREGCIVPSEAAAFLRLAWEGDAMATLAAVATGTEDSFMQGRPNLADRLTKIMREIHHLPDSGEPQAPPFDPGAERFWIMSDLTSEWQRRREWAKVQQRVQLDVAPIQIDYPVQELGHLGAATGPLFASIACTFFATGCAPSQEVTIPLISDGPERGAFVLRNASEAHRRLETSAGAKR